MRIIPEWAGLSACTLYHNCVLCIHDIVLVLPLCCFMYVYVRVEPVYLLATSNNDLYQASSLTSMWLVKGRSIN